MASDALFSFVAYFQERDQQSLVSKDRICIGVQFDSQGQCGTPIWFSVFFSGTPTQQLCNHVKKYIVQITNFDGYTAELNTSISTCQCTSEIAALTPPPRAYPGHLTPFPARGRELDHLSHPGGGAFDHHSPEVVNLLTSLDFLVPDKSSRPRRQTQMHSKVKIRHSCQIG